VGSVKAGRCARLPRQIQP